jgi:dephospho-CoA kinase
MIVGLTGGIATGKSTVASILVQLGATVVDADLVSRDVVSPGSAGLHRIHARFGATMLNEDGSLDRDALGRHVMADPKERAALEAITHPLILEEIATRVQAATIGGAPAVFVEAALLVETGSAAHYPHLWVVICGPGIQAERLMARKGCDRAMAEQWIQSQMPMEEKARHASQIIDNGADLVSLREQVSLAYRKLREPPPDRD